MYRGTSPFNQIGMFGKRITKKNWFPTIANLPASITVNGVSVNPTARYNYKYATTSSLPAWTYGNNLSTMLGSGADPTVGLPSVLSGSIDGAVQYNKAKYHSYGGSASYLDLTTEDIYLEMLVKSGGAVDQLFYIYKILTYGYYLYWANSVSKFAFYLKDTSSNILSVNSGVVSQNTYYFIQIAINKSENPNSNGAYIWTNGTQTAATSSTKILTCTNTDKFRVGLSTGVNTQAYLGIWLQNDWFSDGSTGKAEMDALALSRQKLVKWW